MEGFVDIMNRVWTGETIAHYDAFDGNRSSALGVRIRILFRETRTLRRARSTIWGITRISVVCTWSGMFERKGDMCSLMRLSVVLALLVAVPPTDFTERHISVR